VIACQCRAVSDRTVLDAVACGAHSVAAVGGVCGAGTDCGGCHRTIQRMLDAAAAVDEVFEHDHVAARG
jgi:bacterioferritin-associated ferredoxin